MKQRHHRASPARSFIALAALSAFLFAFVLAASPGWHQHLHADAAQSQHECAITVVQSGTELNESAPLPTAPQPVALVSTIPALHPVWVAPPFSYARIFEHAPPALS